ncbi:hypothetical protein G7D34_003696 [Salmonella enterica]|nr:hypothetical protein [Salmonella enterica]
MNNNFISPADPVGSANAKQIVKGFLDRLAAVRGEGVEPEAPQATQQQAAPAEQEQSEQTKATEMQRYLAPIKMDKFNADAGYTDTHHETFMDNISGDPVFEKIEPMIEAFSNQIKQGVASGQITQERAEMEIQNFIQNVIAPIVKDAHGPHSESHKTSLLTKKSNEIPEFVKQVMGNK